MAMRSPAQIDFLEIGNHGKVRSILSGVISSSEMEKFDAKVNEITRLFFSLGNKHLYVAKKLVASGVKRSTVSRAYYACYSYSRAVRYKVSGHYEVDQKDHNKIGELPKDFPNLAHWNTVLAEMRLDRNTADYEPSAAAVRSMKHKRLLKNFFGVSSLRENAEEFGIIVVDFHCLSLPLDEISIL